MTWLPAVLIGAVTGYGVIFLREMGWLIAVAVTIGLTVVYSRQARYRDFGLFLVAEGLWPSFVAGWGLWQQATRTDTEVGPEMWIFLAAGILLILIGIAIVGRSLLAARRS